MIFNLPSGSVSCLRTAELIKLPPGMDSNRSLTEYRTISSTLGRVTEQMGNSLDSHKAAATSNSATNGVVHTSERGFWRAESGTGTVSCGAKPLVALFSRMDSTTSSRRC